MFDLANLNDFEFESLCRDIMQKKLAKELHIFARGVDEGIDICDKNINPNIMIQVKHYIGSTVAHLKSSLRKEIVKVEKQNPSKYYICTSLTLTRKNKVEIVKMFGEYAPDISFVLDKNDINNFLEESQNEDIAFKNYKLWLCASNVLSLVNNQNTFIDCTELMLDIEAQIKLFVETQAYRDSLKVLNDENIIIIVGAPGVGKSTLSKMILLYYASKDYVVRYVSSNNIGEIKKAISLDKSKKEIVLLDDFLGQHYLNLKDQQPNELRTLISYVEKSKNKKLVLNSRITILNEAIQTYIPFKDMMEKHESKKYLIDLDKMSDLEKAEIFYNHLYFNYMPGDYLTNIKSEKHYLKVIKHKNYNPRIIEYITKRNNYESVNPQEYFTYIIRKLNNPEDVWRDEFRNRLQSSDRILMNTLYSLTDTMIDGKSLEKAFNKRIIKDLNIDTSVNQFRETITRLTNSLLKVVDDKGIAKISVINPSVNDYLLSELTVNESEQIHIINNAVFFEQILKIELSESAIEHLIKKLINEDLLQLSTLENSSFYYFIKSIIKYQIYDVGLKRKLKFSIERAFANLNYRSKQEYGVLIYTLFTGQFCDFYKLHSIFLSSQKMHFILKPMHVDESLKLINAISEEYDISEDEDLIRVFRDSLIEKITDQVQDELEDEILDFAGIVVREADGGEIASYIEDESDQLEDMVWSRLEDRALVKISDYISIIDSQLELEVADFNVTEMRYYFDIGQSLDAILHETDYDDDNYREYGQNQSNDYSLIVKMFER